MSWLPFNKPYKDFVALGRNTPGVLIEILIKDKRKLFLIGDMNPSRSTGGKKLFDENVLVIRYKYLWTKII